MQPDRRLIEHVEHAGPGWRRSAWRVEYAGLRRPTGSRSPSQREVANPDIGQKLEANLESRAGDGPRIKVSRSVSLSVPNTSSAWLIGEIHVSETVCPFTSPSGSRA